MSEYETNIQCETFKIAGQRFWDRSQICLAIAEQLAQLGQVAIVIRMTPRNGPALKSPVSDPDIAAEIAGCRICADRFAGTATGHDPRPVVWFRTGARILIAGQAPGARVHDSGRPFTDPSGDRLRSWLGLSEAEFYDLSRVAIVPMAFCFPGYNARKADLPPPPVCARTWHDRVMASLGPVPLTILVGGHAHRYHLKSVDTVTHTVRNWRNHLPNVFALPHPSWRNTAWLRKNPWFESDLLPVLRARVREVLND